MIPDKKLIEKRFSQAADTYEKQAATQTIVANTLLNMLESRLSSLPKTGLEIGCCTGLLTEKVLARFSSSLQDYTATDLVDAFKDAIEQKTASLPGKNQFIAGDIETLDLPGLYDLIISSSTFHWMHDLPALLQKLTQHLNPAGFLAFSTYGPRNMWEIRETTGLGLDYPNFTSIEASLGQCLGLDLLASYEHEEVLWFPTPIHLLHHMRRTGVNAIDQKPWTRGQLRRFCEDYEQRFSTQQGVPLTYHPMYFIAQKTAAQKTRELVTNSTCVHLAYPA